MFERYYGEGTGWVSREDLSTKTRINLKVLEKDYGFQFDNQARKATFGIGPSYLVYGTSPSGEDVVYERRETSARGAGQTYLWMGGKRHRLGEFQLPPMAAVAKEREVILSLSRVKELQREQEEHQQEYLRKSQEWFKAREEVVDKELGELDLEGFSKEECSNLRTLIGELLDKDLPSTPKGPPYIFDFKPFLTKEEREEVKEAVEEYKKKLREYRGY